MEKSPTIEEVVRGTLEKLEASPEIAKDVVATEKLRSLLLRCLAKFEVKKAS